MKKSTAGILLLTGLAAAWSGAWYIVAQQTDRAITGWIEAEKTRDRSWDCSQREIGGFPFSLRISCQNVSFKSQLGPVRSAITTRFDASLSVFSPFDVAINIASPMKLIARNAEAAVHWNSLDGALSLRRSDPDILLRASDLQLREASGALTDWQTTNVKNFALRIQRAPDRAPDADARLLTISVDDLKASPLDVFFASDDPFRTNVSAIIHNMRSASTGAFAERLDQWSAADGRVEITSLIAEKGASRLEASGELSLDEERRPEGQLSVLVAGVQPLVSRLNLPAAPLAIEGLLRGRGGRGGLSLIENRTLPLVFRSGRLYLGPLRLPIALPPLI